MQFDNNVRDLNTAEDLFQFLATLSAEQRKHLPLQLMVRDDQLVEGTFSASAFSYPDEPICGLRIEVQI